MIAPKIVSNRLAVVLLASIWISSLSGCSITHLQHDDLQEPAQSQSGVVSVDAEATGFSGGRVGWARVTLFSIPVAPVHIKGDEASELMDVVRDALNAAGYTIRLADSSGPVLKAHVDDIRFNNYTWLAPLIITWGRIGVTLQLEAATGNILWKESFKESGNSYNISNGFNVAATESVTRLANSMVEAFSSEEFNAALAGEHGIYTGEIN